MDESSLLRSHIVPPSHILANGQFIHLPPPSSYERSTFFERSVAEHGLIDVGDENDIHGKSKGKSRDEKKKRRQVDDNDTGGGSEGVLSDTNKAKRKKQASAGATTSHIHPFAIASARLRSKGMEELSKAINLSGLVMGGEYFGLTHVIDQQQRLITSNKDSSTSDNGAADKGKNGGSSGVADPSSSSGGGGGKTSDLVDETILQEDMRLRSEYVLLRRQSQYDNASRVLRRHSKRLSLSVGVGRILDNRLQTLRQKWHLVAPEHGKRTVGPIRPREVVAVDVDVYDSGLGGGVKGSSMGEVTCSSPGRIARRVPRYATLELDDEYDVLTDVKSLRTKLSDAIIGLTKFKGGGDDENGENNDSLVDMQVDSIVENGSNDLSTSLRAAETCKTKAEPFAIADPALGKVDPDFDPDKVPLLTLLFEIERPSTGFVERATLSSLISSSSTTTATTTSPRLSGDDPVIQRHDVQPDERVIEALQHSLFCASLWESIRTEITPYSTTSMVGTEMSSSNPRQKSAAWLSSEMEESFLPPPYVMAGGEDSNQIEHTQLLCVIHCHEGEVKVQLDGEYSFTVKLIEAGTTVEAGTHRSDTEIGTDMSQCGTSCSGIGASGSQSPAQLRTLCRSMLLHSQSLYHDHCMMLKRRSTSEAKMKEETTAVGFARMPKKTKLPSPHILKSCVGLGCKFIFERKVRSVLKVSETVSLLLLETVQSVLSMISLRSYTAVGHVA